MKHRTATLEGALLDAAVAMAEGDRLPDYWRDPDDGTCWARPGREEWAPSRLWAQGGPIIERERIHIAPHAPSQQGWSAYAQSTAGRGCMTWDGPTALIAAMRAYVASKFGEEVDLP